MKNLRSLACKYRHAIDTRTDGFGLLRSPMFHFIDDVAPEYSAKFRAFMHRLGLWGEPWPLKPYHPFCVSPAGCDWEGLVLKPRLEVLEMFMVEMESLSS